MRNHTTAYEEAIKTFGRQQAIRITFDNIVLTGDDINSCTPSFKASLLKSCMKEVRIDSNTEIPVGTEIHLEHGILVGNSYEYLDYGYYTVYKVEKKEDTSSFDILCYDKMILAMVDYIDIGIDFPITIRNYIAEICNHLEIDFGSNQDQFVNYDKEIPSELYLDENGDSLNYTFRDVLDELAQVTASVICIDNENKLVVKYPQRQGEFETLEGISLYIENADDTKIDLELQGNTTQNGTPTPTTPIEVNNVTREQVVRVCGKNILPQDKYINDTTINGITYTNNRDGTFSASGTATANTSINIIPVGEIELEANQPYYLYSSIPYNANTFNLSIVMAENNATKYLTANNTYTPTTTPTQERLALWIPNGVSVNIQNAKIMLVKGTTRPTEYEKLQNKDYEINLGKNLYKGSQDFSGTWANSTAWSTAEETYNGLVVKYRQSAWNGLYKEIYAQRGDVYTFSFFAKKETSGRVTAYLTGSGVDATPQNKSFDLTTEWQRFSFTFTITTSGKLRARIENPNNDSITYICGYQLEKNNVMTSYSPYFEPIELNKIGNYQDFIRKGTGKNILNINREQGTFTGNGTQFDENYFYPNMTRDSGVGSNCETIGYADNVLTIKGRYGQGVGYPIKCIPNTQYCVKAKSSDSNARLWVSFYDSTGNFISGSANNTDLERIVTIPNNAYWLIVVFGVNGSSYTNVNYSEIQVEQNSNATYYEPYGYKDKWYIEKNVGKVVLNGSEDYYSQSGGQRYTTFISNARQEQQRNLIYSNRFYYSSSENSVGVGFVYGQYIYLYPNNISSIADLKTWLSNNNATFYYQSINPTYTLIENEELLNQLEAVQLQTGENNVLVSGDLPSTIKVSYVEEFKSIDEEQLKDINVNFGEKFGPINSVVIARAADSDFIYKEDEQSVEENGLCEIRISDNQILNGDSRVEFLNGIYYQLRGTEYYLNDFSSTGITYLDLLDYYKVNVFDNSYKCLMLNDDIKITQGIEEQVHTEMLETTETEYKALSKEGKDIRKTMILVDKVNGRITTEIADVNGNYSSLSGTVSDLSSRVESTETAINGDDDDPDNPGLVKEVQKINSTMLTQDSTSFKAVVEQAQTAFDGVKAYDDDDNLQVIRKQIQFSQDGLTLSTEGTTSDDMKLHLTNEAIEFLYQNHAVLTINGSTIEFSNASFKKLDLGHYVWQAEDDDSLSLIYEGGN